MSFNQDRVVTASIGLRVRTIEEIHRRATANGHSFSREGRDLIEQALLLADAETPQEALQSPETSSTEEMDAAQ